MFLSHAISRVCRNTSSYQQRQIPEANPHFGRTTTLQSFPGFNLTLTFGINVKHPSPDVSWNRISVTSARLHIRVIFEPSQTRIDDREYSQVRFAMTLSLKGTAGAGRVERERKARKGNVTKQTETQRRANIARIAAAPLYDPGHLPIKMVGGYGDGPHYLYILVIAS